METVLKDMSPDTKEEAKLYIFKNQIPQLFESLTAGLLHHRPAHPVEFVQDCLDSVRPAPGQPNPAVRWATFVDWKPAPNSKSASRAQSAQSAQPRAPKSSAKSRASTADSGFRDASSASTAGRTTAPLSACSGSRLQVTPDVSEVKPDAPSGGGGGADTSATPAAAPARTDSPGGSPAPQAWAASASPGAAETKPAAAAAAEEEEEPQASAPPASQETEKVTAKLEEASLAAEVDDPGVDEEAVAEDGDFDPTSFEPPTM